MEKLTQADIDRWRQSLANPRIIKAIYIEDDKAEALFKAAGYYLQEKEIFEEICGNEYETSLGLMVYGVKAKKFFREINAMTQTASIQIDRHTDDENKRLLNIYVGRYNALEDVISTAKAAGLLEGE